VSIQPQPKVFGTVLRTRLLGALALMEESFPAELARVLGSPLFSVQRGLDSLEKEGLVVTRKLGVERRVQLNPRYFAYQELRAILLKLADQDSQLKQALAERRARPRRRGKEI
jgi:DNA-binding MarR family transcriptional regulator